MSSEPRPCPVCGREIRVRVHESCFPRESRDYTGEWLLHCVFCDRYFEPEQTSLGSFGGAGRLGP